MPCVILDILQKKCHHGDAEPPWWMIVFNQGALLGGQEMHAVIKQIIHNRYISLIVGVVIIISASGELLEDLRSWGGNSGLEAHHGVALVGVWQVIKALGEIYETVVVVEED